MRKLCAIFAILLVSVTFAGCGVKSTEDTYPWQVILGITFEMKNEQILAGAVGTLKEKLDTPHVTHLGAKKELHIVFVFKDFSKFNTHFEMNVSDKIDVEIITKTFFRERTITFKNPWVAVSENEEARDVTAGIVETVRSTVTASYLDPAILPEYYYIFASSIRRTNVPNSTRSQITGNYDYVFDDSTDEVLIFDRFANQPIWYGIAVGAAGIFMIAAYLLFARAKKRRYNN